MNYHRVISAMTSTPVLLHEEYAEMARGLIEKIAFSPEMLDKNIASAEANGVYSYVRDGIGIVVIDGPVTRYPAGFCMVTQSTQDISVELQSLIDNSSVDGIVLHFVNAPGGEATGINDLSAQIKAAGKVKPITSFIEGMAASAHYWIATAANKVVMSETAMVGSVGAVFTFRQNTESKSIEIVSEQSPKKRLDIQTEEGQSEYRTLATDLAQVFINTVAKNRGVTPEKVQADFGQGLVYIASKAIERGMADKVGTLDSVIADMTKKISNNNINRESYMSDNSNVSAPQTAVTQDTTLERMTKIKAVFEGAGLSNHPSIIELAMDGKSGELEAMKTVASILKAENESLKSKDNAVAKELEARAEDAKKLDVIESKTSVEQEAITPFTRSYEAALDRRLK